MCSVFYRLKNAVGTYKPSINQQRTLLAIWSYPAVLFPILRVTLLYLHPQVQLSQYSGMRISHINHSNSRANLSLEIRVLSEGFHDLPRLVEYSPILIKTVAICGI